jgi:lysophospholipase L1-like esterase
MSRRACGLRPLWLLALLAVALLAAEAALRVSRLGLSRAALGRWQRRVPWEAIRTLDDGGPWPRPNGAARWALQPGSPVVEYRIDGEGFRVPAVAAPPAGRGACRVLVLGDSNPFGYGVPAEDAFPAQLERLLRDRGGDVVVRNAGICGSDVAQQRRWVEALLARESPDVAVLAVSPWSLRTDRPPPPPPGRTLPEKLWNVANGRTAALAAWSAVADRVRRRTFHWLAAVAGWPPPSLVAWELQPLVEPRAAFDVRFAVAAAEVQRAVERLRAAQATPLLVFVPLDVQLGTGRNALYRRERLPYPSWGFVDRDYTRDRRYAEALRRLAGVLEVPLVDATNPLATRADDGYLRDDYHLSAGGHRRIAEEIASAVRDACDRTVVASSPDGAAS